MDTWMTSSCTPEINADWGGKGERKGFLPMSLRPQAHDIIRTWAFYTLVKSYYHRGEIPWKDIMISGHGLDPQGKKMSKSKGNFVIAEEVIKKYSADAFRFWAASVKLGEDLPFLEKEVVAGQKFANKLWNAFRFCSPHLEDYQNKTRMNASEIFDRWLLSKLQKLIKESTESFERYEYSRTKAEVEKFFWHIFCDQYLEIVKDRFYNAEKRGEEGKRSAQAGLYQGILSIIKLMAPITPYITEEIYQAGFKGREKEKSIHISGWPEFKEKMVDREAEEIGDLGVDIINAVRKLKSEQKKSMKEEVKELVLASLERGFKEKIGKIEEDLKGVLNAREIRFEGKTALESERFKIKIGIVL